MLSFLKKALSMFAPKDSYSTQRSIPNNAERQLEPLRAILSIKQENGKEQVLVLDERVLEAQQLLHRVQVQILEGIDKSTLRPFLTSNLMQALELMRQFPGPDDMLAVQCLIQLSELLILIDENETAEHCLRRALQATKDLLHDDSATRSVLLRRLGETLVETGRPLEAVVLLRECVGLYESKVNDPGARTDASRLLAVALDNLGHHAEALPIFERVLGEYTASKGTESDEVALTLDNLARLQLRNEKIESALNCASRSLDITERLYDLEDPRVALRLETVAMIHKRRGSFPVAEAMLRRAVRLTESKPEVGHRLGVLLGNLAGVLLEEGKRSESIAVLHKALAAKEQYLGKNHPSVAQTLNNVACFYAQDGDFVAAESAASRCFEIRKAAFGVEHPETLASASLLDKVRRDREHRPVTPAAARSSTAVDARASLRPLSDLTARAIEKHQDSFILKKESQRDTPLGKRLATPEYQSLLDADLSREEKDALQSECLLPLSAIKVNDTGRLTELIDPPNIGMPLSPLAYLRSWETNFSIALSDAPKAVDIVMQTLRHASAEYKYSRRDCQALVDRLWKDRWIIDVVECAHLRLGVLANDDTDLQRLRDEGSEAAEGVELIERTLQLARDSASLDCWLRHLYSLLPLTLYVLLLTRDVKHPDANKYDRYVDEVHADIGTQLGMLLQDGVLAHSDSVWTDLYVLRPMRDEFHPLSDISAIQEHLKYHMQGRVFYPQFWADGVIRGLQRNPASFGPELNKFSHQHLASMLITEARDDRHMDLFLDL
jgi:tetratricopeptide (TPR) repeat protein